MKSLTGLEEIARWATRSIALKLLVMGLLMLVLLIPSVMIQSTINERQSRQVGAVSEITSKWGGAQVLAGPVLTVPYLTHFKNDKGQPFTQTAYAYFLPEELHVHGDVGTQIRYRGMYQAVLYQSTLAVNGKFSAPDFSVWHVAPEDILWKDAQLSFGIPDMRGIQNTLDVEWNGRPLTLNPGIALPGFLKSGVSAKAPWQEKGGPFTFSMAVKLNGSDSLQIYPFGKKTTLELTSTWADPSFIGNFLPAERHITSKGFSASWTVLHLNRNYPQQWLSSETQDIEASGFGVQLLTPVDQYQKTMRSTKYAVLFILLTFGTLFFIEILNKKAVHVFQYLLIGLALLLFYSVLLSLAEHIGFGWAYLLSSAVIVTMISLYAEGILAARRLTWRVAAIMAGLYVYLYALLQLEDYALLIGNVGLLAALGLAMYLSRRADWYIQYRGD